MSTTSSADSDPDVPATSHELNSPPPSGELGKRVSRGLGWSLLGQIFTRVGVFASGIVLARLLAPIDMGEVAAALVVVNIILAINELGVIPALVRWTGDLREAAATATTIAVVNSVAMYGVAFFVAPMVSSLTNTPGSIWVIRIMSLSVLVDGLIAVPLAMLFRQIRVIPQVLCESAGMAVYIAVSIGLASTGVDANAIAWGRALGALATGALMLSVSWWPARPAFNRQVASELLRFGMPLAVSAAVFEGVMSVDYLIVGRELGEQRWACTCSRSTSRVGRCRS